MNEITKNTIELVNTLNSEEECIIEISKDNRYIVRINKDGKLKYIGSKYSVERDIEKFISDINSIEANQTIIIFGLGAGEHIKYLVNNLSSANKIFIVEPNAEIIKETLKLDCIKNILEDNRIALCFLNNKIKKYINDFIDDYNINNSKIVSFANYSSICENEYNYFIKQLEKVINSQKMVTNTFNTFSNEFFNNFMGNIFTVGDEGFYSVNQLKNLYKGKPAVIVSAGPSLTKNVHLLKEVQDKFIIICGPRTIGTLIENGITPDFACSIDPQDKVYTLMEKYIDVKVPLVFMDSSNSRIVKEQKGPRIIVANQGMEIYLEQMIGIKVDSLMQGGSVAHFSMGLAYYLGCTTIIFIGQDLAYTNDKFQADGTYAGEMDQIKYDYEKDREKWDKDKRYNVYVKDIYGRIVRTSAVLKSYIDEFEDLISDCDTIKVINSTEGGAHIDGTEVIPLKDTIELYAGEIINKNLKDLLEEPIIANEEEFTERMFKIIDKLEIIKKACEQGIKYSEQMLCFYKYNKPCNLNKVFSELDRIDIVINNRDDLGFLTYSLASAIDNVMNNEYFKEKENETEKELGMRLAERGLFVYLSVCQTVEDAIIIIKNEFICESHGNQVNKVFLKKNLHKRIQKLHKEYDNLKEIDLVNDTDLKEKGVRYKILDDGSFLFLHKPVENITKEMWKLLIGDVEINEDSVKVHNIIENTKFYDVVNYSLVLLKETPINIKNDKIIYVKFRKTKDTNVHLRFLDKKFLSLYEEIWKKNKTIDDYKNSKLGCFDIDFVSDTVRCTLRFEDTVLYQSSLRNLKYDEIEFIIDLERGIICINKEVLKISKNIIEKYINNCYFSICSYTEIKENIEYEIKNVELGWNKEQVSTDKIDNDIIFFSGFNSEDIFNNNINLKTATKVYKLFVF
jgi:Uncharacterized protein conserved in bacteria